MTSKFYTGLPLFSFLHVKLSFNENFKTIFICKLTFMNTVLNKSLKTNFIVWRWQSYFSCLILPLIEQNFLISAATEHELLLEDNLHGCAEKRGVQCGETYKRHVRATAGQETHHLHWRHEHAPGQLDNYGFSPSTLFYQYFYFFIIS